MGLCVWVRKRGPTKAVSPLRQGEDVILPVDEEYVEVFGCHEALRRLGFSADDIYVVPGISAKFKERCLHVVLKTQGKEYVITAARLKTPKEDEQVRDEWLSTIDIIKRARPDQQQRIWAASAMGADVSTFQALALSLLTKGFALPKAGEREANEYDDVDGTPDEIQTVLDVMNGLGKVDPAKQN
jgi:hypothetical protein